MATWPLSRVGKDRDENREHREYQNCERPTLGESWEGAVVGCTEESHRRHKDKYDCENGHHFESLHDRLGNFPVWTTLSFGKEAADEIEGEE